MSESHEEGTATAASGGVFALGQKLLREAVNALNASVAHLQRQERGRKAVAYLLKGIVAFGGLAITLGLQLPYSRGAGIAMMVAVTFDQFVSNHRSLLRIAEAAAASEALSAQTTSEHQLRHVACLQLKDSDPVAGKRCLHDLNLRVTKTIQTGMEQIRSSLRTGDIEQLRLLAIEHKQTEAAMKAAAPLPPPAPQAG
jgi:hypothetical protein